MVVRQLIRAKLFSVPVVAGSALAIGATTSVFSVFHAMLIRPMGSGQVENLAAIWRTDEAHGQKNVEVSNGDLLEWRRAACALDGVALASSVNLDFPLVLGGVPEHVDGTTVTGNFFQVVGALPHAGGLLTGGGRRHTDAGGAIGGG